MTTLKKRPNYTIAGVFVGLAFIFIFRTNEWFHTFQSNYWLITYNQIPIWQTVADEDSPLHSPLFKVPSDQFSHNVSMARGLGLILFNQGLIDEALEIWQVAGLSTTEVFSIQAQYALSLNRQDVAISWYELAVNWDPASWSSWHALGELYAQNNQVEQSIDAYEMAVDLGSVESVDPLAKLWRDKGDHIEATRIWNSALRTFPGASERLSWWQGLSNSYRALEKWEMGLSAVEQGLIEFPNDARLHVEKGAHIYGVSADVNAAISSIQEAILIAPTLATAYSTMANILASEKRFDEAYDFYTTAINYSPQTQSWYLARGHMARASGDLTLALQSFLDAVDIFPEFLPAYFDLANMYRQLDDKENATLVINQALQLESKLNAQDYVTAGEIFEWQGDINRAIFAFEQALIIDPENVNAYNALQRILEK